MRFPSSLLSSVLLVANALSTEAYTYDRLDRDKAVLLVVDEQDGLFLMARDYSSVEFKNSVIAHAAIGNLFNLPTVMTTSADTGPNGPIINELRALHPDAPLIRRPGEVNAWDNPDFRAAVNATGRSQAIIAGIVTDVCTTFLALSLRDAGYSVFANADASGTSDIRTAKDANDRMRAAGVNVMSTLAIVAELQRDWRNPPGAPAILEFFDNYNPQFGFLARAHDASIASGVLSGLPDGVNGTDTGNGTAPGNGTDSGT